MSSTFAQADRLLFTSESVTEGHPDKLCDQVSDAILDAYLEVDPKARVACETAASTGLIFVLGEITAGGDSVDIRRIVRRTVGEIGYTDSSHGFDAETCGVTVSVNEQSADIKMGVDEALEVRDLDGDYAEVEGLGAGDQGMMYGLRLRRDAGVDARAHRAGPSRRPPIGRRPQGWNPPLAAARRQVPGHRRIPLRAPRAGRRRRAGRAARPRHRQRQHRAGVDRETSSAKPSRPSGSTTTPASSSTGPAAS